MWCIVRVPDVAKRIVFIIEADQEHLSGPFFVAVPENFAARLNGRDGNQHSLVQNAHDDIGTTFLLLISMNLLAEDSPGRIFEEEKIDLGEIAKGFQGAVRISNDESLRTRYGSNRNRQQLWLRLHFHRPLLRLTR